MDNKTNKTIMSIRDFVIIYKLVETELNGLRSMFWADTRRYHSSMLTRDEIDAKVKEQLDNNMRYQELLSIINRLDSMFIDVSVPDVEIEDKTDNLTN